MSSAFTCHDRRSHSAEATGNRIGGEGDLRRCFVAHRAGSGMSSQGCHYFVLVAPKRQMLVPKVKSLKQILKNNDLIIKNLRHLVFCIKKLVPMEVKVGTHLGVGCHLMISLCL